MLRFVQVPTVYCRDSLDDMFDRPWNFQHTPRSVPCRRRRVCSPPMTYPTFGSFIAAMEAMDTSSCDENKETENACNSCCCEKQKTKRSPEDKDQSSANDQSSEIEPKTEVSIPLSKPSDTDSRRFRLSLNLSSFDPEHIEVKRVDKELKIHAKQDVERCGMMFHREIQRSYHLPDDIDSDSFKSTLSAASVLTVEAQRTPKGSNADSQQSEEHRKEESTSEIHGNSSERLETEGSAEKSADEEVKEETQDREDPTPTDEMEVEETEKPSQEE